MGHLAWTRRNRAFTLIELLVVIAILAILAWPVVAPVCGWSALACSNHHAPFRRRRPGDGPRGSRSAINNCAWVLGVGSWSADSD